MLPRSGTLVRNSLPYGCNHARQTQARSTCSADAPSVVPTLASLSNVRIGVAVSLVEYSIPRATTHFLRLAQAAIDEYTLHRSGGGGTREQ